MNNAYRQALPKQLETAAGDGSGTEKLPVEVPFGMMMEGESLVGQIPDPDCNVEEEAICRVDAARLHEVIEELDEEERQIINLLYFENKTLQETGDRIGVSKQAVSKRLPTILGKLRQLLR